MGRSELGFVRRHRGALVAPILALALAGCTALDDMLASIPAFNFMRRSPAFSPYEAPRPAPPGAVPFAAPGGTPPPPLQSTEAALNEFGATVANPVAPTPEALALGQELYQRYCFVCHGPTGMGDGPIIARPGDEPGSKFPFATNLTLPATVQRTDGYIYGVIRVGRGLMPVYGDKIPNLERWTIVHYVRQLQRAAGTLPAEPAAPAAGPSAALGPAGAGAAVHGAPAAGDGPGVGRR